MIHSFFPAHSSLKPRSMLVKSPPCPSIHLKRFSCRILCNSTLHHHAVQFRSIRSVDSNRFFLFILWIAILEHPPHSTHISPSLFLQLNIHQVQQQKEWRRSQWMNISSTQFRWALYIASSVCRNSLHISSTDRQFVLANHPLIDSLTHSVTSRMTLESDVQEIIKATKKITKKSDKGE